MHSQTQMKSGFLREVAKRLRRTNEACDASYTDAQETVLEHEKTRIHKDPSANEANALCGLAISGGGIRSASFGLGFLQALAHGGMLARIDYLSTVSGGGYIGSALTWLLKDRGEAAGTTPADFPFAEHGARSQILGFMRQHGNYLIPGSGLGYPALFAVVLRSIVVSLFVYFSLLCLVVVAALSILNPAWETLEKYLAPIGIDNWFLLAATVAGFVFFGGSLLSAIAARMTYGARTSAQKLFGLALTAIAVSCVIGSLPLVMTKLSHAVALGSGWSLSLLGGLVGYLQSNRQQNPAKQSSGPRTLLIVAGAAGLAYGILLSAFAVGDWLVPYGDSNPKINEYWLVVVIVGMTALGVGSVVNLNYFGLHRMYRDRLMETFLPDQERVEDSRWGLATRADVALVENLCSEQRPRPYHLINANVVLTNSSISKFRGRGGDSFILSPLYCGSRATGWRSSSSYMKKSGRGMTLPTAMAISAAAANPNTGSAGRGITTSRSLSMLMSLLNIRLGYWAPHPNPARSERFRLPPNLIYPGFSSGILGLGNDENARAIELTDGGHFENLGLYELIRRRLKTIIVSDGGCDPTFDFADLANAVERVRVDFGADINFDDPEYGLCALQPGTGCGCNALESRYELAKRGFAIGTIEYKADAHGHRQRGTLIYCKTTMTPGLPADVQGYKNAHPRFPDETTADQFFDEAQFEAYRALGHHIGTQLTETNRAAAGSPEPSAALAPPWV